ncbi:MAG: NACHT domain-containing protein [Elainella sp. C42_A2020_010]|nr:NACHT domain-containing protein [Elainella sp. C42_A2020_010]
MNFQQGLEIVNQVMLADMGRPLTEVEIALLTGAWHDHTYEQIAAASGYSLNYLQRDAGPKFWKLLSQVFDRKLNKTTVWTVLERFEFTLQQAQSSTVSSAQLDPTLSSASAPAPPPLPSPPAPQPLQPNSAGASHTTQRSQISALQQAALKPPPGLIATDWSEAVDVSVFYGRTEELNTLREWILQEHCRLIALLGMGGIGKSSLAAKIAHQLQDQFEYVVWRSLRDAPPLPTLLADLVQFLSNQQETQATLPRLLHYLRIHRCLLILDNVETIFQEGDRAGYCQPDYEPYGDLFKLLGEASHQSCLLLTSREKPAEVGALEGSGVRSLHLTGSAEAALALIESRGLQGAETQKQQLCERYRCSPLAIKIIATSIQSLFDGDIASFLEQDTIVFNGLRRLLDQQFERLSPLERTLMYWLAINREWTTVADLMADIFPPVPRSSVLEALESLHWRSLIEKVQPSGQKTHYTQQPVVMEYVTNHLITAITTELITGRLSCLLRYALLKTSVKDYIRAGQLRLILEPIATRLREVFSTASAQTQRLQAILQRLRADAVSCGYAAGNLINLANYLGLDLTNYDFSHLTVWHGYFQQAILQRVNFAYADLSNSVFLQTFGYVLSVAFSPDGEWIATGDGNGQVRLWQTADGQPSEILADAYTGWVWTVAFSPDGAMLAGGGVDPTIKLWNPATGECLSALQGHDNWVRAVAWSPDGQILASGSTDRTIKLWNPYTGACLQTLQAGEAVWSVSWSPDGKHLSSGGIDQQVRLWDIHTGTVVRTLAGHKHWIRTVSWSLDGTRIASAGDDQTIRIWDVETGECWAVLQGHQAAVWSLSWSPDSAHLASAAHDQTIRIWDVAAQQCLKILSDHSNWVWGVDWSRNGELLASVAHDRTIKIWQVQTWSCLRTVEGYTSVGMSLAWNPQGRVLAASCDDRVVRLWDTRSGHCFRTLYGHSNVVWDVSWSPDGQMLASSCDDYTVRIWHPTTGDCLHVLEHGNWVWSVDWSPNGECLATGTQDYVVMIWDLKLKQRLRVLEGHCDSIWTVAWCPDGERIASGCDDCTVRIWHAKTGECLQVLRHDHSVRSVTWSPDGKFLATGSAGCCVQIWDADRGECLKALAGHTSSIWSVAWHPNGHLIASGGSDLGLRLWHVETGECLQTLKGHTGQVWSVAWSPDGRTLASSSADCTIRLWNPVRSSTENILRAERPYEGMNITGVTGLTEAQKMTLKALGAIES